VESGESFRKLWVGGVSSAHGAKRHGADARLVRLHFGAVRTPQVLFQRVVETCLLRVHVYGRRLVLRQAVWVSAGEAHEVQPSTSCDDLPRALQARRGDGADNGGRWAQCGTSMPSSSTEARGIAQPRQANIMASKMGISGVLLRPTMGTKETLGPR
jgi:hypothetical protein